MTNLIISGYIAVPDLTAETWEVSDLESVFNRFNPIQSVINDLSYRLEDMENNTNVPDYLYENNMDDDFDLDDFGEWLYNQKLLDRNVIKTVSFTEMFEDGCHGYDYEAVLSLEIEDLINRYNGNKE